MDGVSKGGEGDFELFVKIVEVLLILFILQPVLSTALKFAAILDNRSDTPPTGEENLDGEDECEECLFSDGGADVSL